MNIRTLIIITIILLGLAGCTFTTATPQFVGNGEGLAPPPLLGVVANEKYEVVEVMPRTAAETSELKVGDVLVDLRWIPSDEPAYAPHTGSYSVTEADGIYFVSPIVAPGVVTPVPSPVSSYVEKEPVPFTDHKRVNKLIWLGVSLEMTIIRDGKEMRFTVKPMRPKGRELGQPPLTPVPDSFLVF